VAVASTGSFGAAAKQCAVSQPGLSGQIQQLESMLELALFERDRRTVRLTEAGIALLPRAQSILAETQSLVDESKALKGPLVGRVRLGAIPTIAPYLLPQALPAVEAAYPQLEVELTEAHTDKLIDQLMRGDLDVLVVALEADLGSSMTLPLFSDDFVAVVPSAHELARRKTIEESELGRAPVLLLDDGHCLRDQVWAVCGRAGAESAGNFRASSLGTVCRMVAGGRGVTLVPAMALEAEAKIDDVSIVPFKAPRPQRTIGLAWRPSSPRADDYGLLGEVLSRFSALGSAES